MDDINNSSSMQSNNDNPMITTPPPESHHLHMDRKPKTPNKHSGQRNYNIIETWIWAVNSYLVLAQARRPYIYHALVTLPDARRLRILTAAALLSVLLTLCLLLLRWPPSPRPPKLSTDYAASPGHFSIEPFLPPNQTWQYAVLPGFFAQSLNSTDDSTFDFVTPHRAFPKNALADVDEIEFRAFK